MFGKFSFFFLAALCALQGFDARSVDQRDINDIIANIKELIDKIEKAIKNAINNLPEIIKSIKDKIQEIISNINIPEMIKNIKEKLDEILKQAGIDIAAAKQCIAAATDATQKLAEETNAAITKCASDATGKVEEIEKIVQGVADAGAKLVGKLTSGLGKCIRDGGGLSQIVQCLTNLLSSETDEAAALGQKIQKAIEDAKDIAGQAVNELTTCAAQISDNILKKEKVIEDDFKTCISAIKQ